MSQYYSKEDEIFFNSLGKPKTPPPPIQPLETRFEQYDLLEEKLEEFFKSQSFCLDSCVKNEFSLYGLVRFGLIPKENERQDPKYGCCFEDKFRSDFSPNVKERFLKLQKENLNPTLQSTKGGCSYHTTKGCALTKHKSPVCISYACTSLKYELRSKYAVAYRGASISLLFEHILKGKITNQILEETIENITKATQRIKEVKAGNNPQIKKEIHIIY